MTTCQKCGLPIAFVKREGKLWPTELDGSDHFDKCSAARWKNVSTNGTRFSDDSGNGFLLNGKKHYEMQIGKTTRVTNHSLPSCDCTTPPWEDCLHTNGTPQT